MHGTQGRPVVQRPPESWGEPLPRPVLEDVRAIARAHREYTGVWGDGLHPRHGDWLSDEALETYITIMIAARDLGYALGDVGGIIGLFIGKARGGYRIVSLLTTIIRWWEAIRVCHAFQWKERNAREYFWG